MIQIGVDIGATKTVIATKNECGELEAFSKVLSAKMLQGKNHPVDSLANFLDDYIRTLGIQKEQIQGIGIGVPGMMDKHTRTIVSCPNLPGLDQLPLSELLTVRLGIPVLVEKDTNLIALGEHAFGRGKGIDDLACIYVGSGLGCGLIFNGQLYIGADGGAGEFGHTIYEPNGKPCGCGGRGCVESYCSGRALALKASEILDAGELPSGPDASQADYAPWALAENVIHAAKSGNQRSIQALGEAFSALGFAITNLVNLLNPSLIILGGGIVTGWPEGLEKVREIVLANARPIVRNRLAIDFPVLGEKAGLYGATYLVSQYRPE